MVDAATETRRRAGLLERVEDADHAIGSRNDGDPVIALEPRRVVGRRGKTRPVAGQRNRAASRRHEPRQLGLSRMVGDHIIQCQAGDIGATVTDQPLLLIGLRQPLGILEPLALGRRVDAEPELRREDPAEHHEHEDGGLDAIPPPALALFGPDGDLHAVFPSRRRSSSYELTEMAPRSIARLRIPSVMTK